MIPKMKRLDKRQRYRIKIPLINLVFIFAAILMFTCSTFINVDIKHYILPAGIFSNAPLTSDDFIYSFFFIPQVPVVLFAAAVLGRKMSVISIILYLLAGLCGAPVFALGGGFQYAAQFGFGYLLGYIPAAITAGSFLEEKYNFLNMIKAAICGVLIIHVTGILYMILIALIRHAGSPFIGSWIVSQSGLKIIYDIIASFILILIGKYLNEGLRYILH